MRLKIILLFFVVGLGFLAFQGRNKLLMFGLEKISNHINQKYGIQVQFEEAQWLSYCEIGAKNLIFSGPKQLVGTVSDVKISFQYFGFKIKNLAWSSARINRISASNKPQKADSKTPSNAFFLLRKVKEIPAQLDLKNSEISISEKKYLFDQVDWNGEMLFVRGSQFDSLGCAQSFQVDGKRDSITGNFCAFFKTTEDVFQFHQGIAFSSFEWESHVGEIDPEERFIALKVHSPVIHKSWLSPQPIRPSKVEINLHFLNREASVFLETEISISKKWRLNACFVQANPGHTSFFIQHPIQEMGKSFQALSGGFSSFSNIWADDRIGFNLSGKVDPEGKVKNLNFAYTFQMGKKTPYSIQFLEEMGIRLKSIGKQPIAQKVKMSVVFAEDPLFYSHVGFDSSGVLLAVKENIENRKLSRGGGSLTMQTMRLMGLGHEKNAMRKWEEWLFSLSLQARKTFSKDEILALYLNLAEWGPSIFGIEKAANFYFRKNVTQLDVNEACFLAILLPNPRHFRELFNETGGLTEASILVMDGLKYQLWKAGIINDSELDSDPKDLKISFFSNVPKESS